MRQLGVAAEPIALPRLTPSVLAAAIRETVSDPGMAAAARRLGERVRAENGVGAAVNLLEQAAADSR